jgi:hypothetical protein
VETIEEMTYLDFKMAVDALDGRIPTCVFVDWHNKLDVLNTRKKIAHKKYGKRRAYVWVSPMDCLELWNR